jgi:pimeloyl-ACP methyl ester carboxylesterase
MVAARRPHLVRTLTLVSPALPARFPSRGGAGLLLLATPRVGERLLASGARRPVERRARELLELVFADPAAVGEEDLADLVEELRRRGELPHAGPALLESLRGLATVHLLQSRRTWQLARSVTAPTLVLYGGRDRLVSATAARRARRMFVHGRVEVDPTGGHIPQREHPRTAAEALVRHALVYGAMPRTV